MTALTDLRLTRTHVADLTPLAGLTALTTINLSMTKKLTDLTPLARLKALKTLNLVDTSVTDLSPLAGLKALEVLNLFRTQVSDAGVKKLQAALSNLEIER